MIFIFFSIPGNFQSIFLNQEFSEVLVKLHDFPLAFMIVRYVPKEMEPRSDTRVANTQMKLHRAMVHLEPSIGQATAGAQQPSARADLGYRCLIFDFQVTLGVLKADRRTRSELFSKRPARCRLCGD